MNLNASKISSHLYQGAYPPTGTTLESNGFTLLVLAAEEYQPSSNFFPGVQVVHAPLDDHPYQLSQAEWDAIVRSAKLAGDNVMRGGRSLITCWEGRNRSGIITAVTLTLLTGWPADKAVARIRSRRPGALTNESFVRQLRRVF